MAIAMKWDQEGERLFETGVEQAALFPYIDNGYSTGEPWNGLTGVTESPSGAEATAIYANNKKYLDLVSTETFGGTIEAYTYPDGFKACNGEGSLGDGVSVGQQTRIPFGLVYKSLIGNDTKGIKYGYKLHIVYGARVSPSEHANSTVNESVEATTMSWEFTTTPIEVTGMDASSHIIIDSRNFVNTEEDQTKAAKLTALEEYIYGNGTEKATLPTPDKIIELLGLNAG